MNWTAETVTLELEQLFFLSFTSFAKHYAQMHYLFSLSIL